MSPTPSQHQYQAATTGFRRLQRARSSSTEMDSVWSQTGTFRWFVLGGILLCFSICASFAESESVAGTRVTIEKPPGFEKATTFSGFQKSDVAASIMITELPAPFRSATAGFDEKKMAERGMKLLSKVDSKVSNYDGMVVEFTQSAQGIAFHKWILAFGDDTFTQLVSATCPETEANQLGAVMKHAVLTASFDASKSPMQPKDLGFEVSEVPGLKLATLVQNAMIFNTTGQLPKQKLDYTPVSFVAAQSISTGRMEIKDKVKFAQERLLVSPELSGVQLLSETDVKLANLPGREIVATAKSKSNEELFVYQVMLFPADGYYLMRAECLLSQRKEYEPSFKSLARTFRLRTAN